MLKTEKSRINFQKNPRFLKKELKSRKQELLLELIYIYILYIKKPKNISSLDLFRNTQKTGRDMIIVIDNYSVHTSMFNLSKT